MLPFQKIVTSFNALRGNHKHINVTFSCRFLSGSRLLLLRFGQYLLDKGFREFLPGYAVTSYGSQGKTVDFVLFSDSTIKAATNSQQWYVTISRGRRGIRIFTPDKEQLRENVARSGHRPLALEFADEFRQQEGVLLWDKLHGYLLRYGQRAADTFCRLKKACRHSRNLQQKRIQKHEHQVTRMLGD